MVLRQISTVVVATALDAASTPHAVKIMIVQATYVATPVYVSGNRKEAGVDRVVRARRGYAVAAIFV